MTWAFDGRFAINSNSNSLLDGNHCVSTTRSSTSPNSHSHLLLTLIRLNRWINFLMVAASSTGKNSHWREEAVSLEPTASLFKRWVRKETITNMEFVCLNNCLNSRRIIQRNCEPKSMTALLGMNKTIRNSTTAHPIKCSFTWWWSGSFVTFWLTTKDIARGLCI